MAMKQKTSAVEWEEVPAENLTKAGQFTVRGRVPTAGGVLVRSQNKTWCESPLTENPNYDENSNQAFASASNIYLTTAHDRVDYHR